MRQIKNQAAVLAALGVLAGLASCSDDDTPAQTDPSPVADAGSTPSATPDPDYTVVSTTYLTGPGRWAMQAAGDPEAPLAVIDVPSGYQGREDFVWTHDELDLDVNMGQVLYRAPTRVYADPCEPGRRSPRLGPTVEDLADGGSAGRPEVDHHHQARCRQARRLQRGPPRADHA